MTTPNRGALLHEGKAKQVYATDDENLIWMHYKDSATAFNGVKKAEIADKGVINSQISAHILRIMEERGIPTHLVAEVTPRDQLCTKVQIIPVEVVVRNIVAGSAAKRFGFEEGMVLKAPMVEWFYKSDELNDPPMSDCHALLFGWAEQWELEYLRHAAIKVNDVLREFWDGLGVTLVDFKIEFGRTPKGHILLADEITPDGSRLWEKGTNRKLDKDVFRRDLGDLSATYHELFARVFGRELST